MYNGHSGVSIAWSINIAYGHTWVLESGDEDEAASEAYLQLGEVTPQRRTVVRQTAAADANDVYLGRAHQNA